ncbi:MAG: hypothetical protein JWN37_12 [Candidatus Nomurabacteria bacterium]|nr:hypothetical protein [Candidatus Nomurabacteria bacterium]
MSKKLLKVKKIPLLLLGAVLGIIATKIGSSSHSVVYDSNVLSITKAYADFPASTDPGGDYPTIGVAGGDCGGGGGGDCGGGE